MHSELFFYLGLSAIVIHEMDAVRCKEWRIFPGLSLLNDDWGYKLFMLAHVPLFYFLFEGLMENDHHGSLKFGLDVFFMIHVVLHLLFLKHPKNEFKDMVSWAIIISAGLFGLLDILVEMQVFS